MGVKNLKNLLNDNVPNSFKNTNTKSLKNKKIAIDTSIILYQSITAIRGSGSDLKGPDNKSTSHIHGILIKTLNYLKNDLIPIHIFDGKAPQLKKKILNDRSKIKKDAINKLLELEERITTENLSEKELDAIETEKIKLLKSSVSVSYSDTREVAQIVELLGVPFIFAPEEADSQCAYLSRNDLVDYIASEDMDLLTFGSKKLLKNFMKKDMYEIDLNKILSDSNFTMDQFIDLCILLGCDYTDTIYGIGPKKAWELIKKYESIENIITLEQKITKAVYKLPDNFRYEESREYFKNARHVQVKSTDLELKVPKLNELKKLLIDKYGYDEDNVEHMIKFIRNKYKQYDKNYKPKVKVDKIEDPFLDNSEEEHKHKPNPNPKHKPNPNPKPNPKPNPNPNPKPNPKPINNISDITEKILSKIESEKNTLSLKKVLGINKEINDDNLTRLTNELIIKIKEEQDSLKFSDNSTIKSNIIKKLIGVKS